MSDLDFSNTPLENADINQELIKSKSANRHVPTNRIRIISGLAVLALVLLSIFVVIQLVDENQDNRQQAKFCDDDPESPYYDPSCLPTSSLTPSTTTNPNKDRPKTESNCVG